MKKWTNQRIDEAVASRSIKRLTDCLMVPQPSTTPIKWKCTVCEFEWFARVDNIIGKQSGCPHCAGNIMHTTNSFNEKLSSQNRTDIVCLEIHRQAVGSNQHPYRYGTFQCNKCNNIWKANIHNIVKFRYVCPKCNDNLSIRVVDDEGNSFHSKLEFYFWKEIKLKRPKTQVLRQQKYASGRRLTCDYVLPDLNTWVEISGRMMLQRSDYKSSLNHKRKIVEDRGHTFVVLSDTTEINKFIITIPI